MVVTKQKICFARPDSQALLDYIPLEGILNVALSKQNRVSMFGSLSKSIKSMIRAPAAESQEQGDDRSLSHHAPHATHEDHVGGGGSPKYSARRGNLDAGDEDSLNACIVIVKTEREGHNAGRTYQIRAKTMERAEEIVKTLKKCVDEALEDEGDMWVTRYQRKAKALYDSDAVQMGVALLIVSAFLLSIVR